MSQKHRILIYTADGIVDARTGRPPVLDGTVPYRLSADLWAAVFGAQRMSSPTAVDAGLAADLSLHVDDFDPVATGRKYGCEDGALTAGVIGLRMFARTQQPAKALVQIMMSSRAAYLTEQNAAGALGFDTPNALSRWKVRADATRTWLKRPLSSIAADVAAALWPGPVPKEIHVAPVAPSTVTGAVALLVALDIALNGTDGSVRKTSRPTLGLTWQYPPAVMAQVGRDASAGTRVTNTSTGTTYRVTACMRSGAVTEDGIATGSVCAGGHVWTSTPRTIDADDATLRDMYCGGSGIMRRWERRDDLWVRWPAGWVAPDGKIPASEPTDADRLATTMGTRSAEDVAREAATTVEDVRSVLAGAAPLTENLLAWVLDEEEAVAAVGAAVSP